MSTKKILNYFLSQEINQRTNGPVDAHLLGLVKHKTWIIYGKEMTLTFNTHLPS